MSRRPGPITILMADDDADDRLMTREAFAESRLGNDLRFVEDGVELMDYLKNSANKEYQSLEEGYFEIVPNAQLASNLILVYETKADNAGKHFVAMGDGSVSAGTTQEVKAALGIR